MSTPTIPVLPAPVGLLPLLAAAAHLPPLEGADEGAAVGISALAFRHGARIETHAASVLTRYRDGLLEPELRHTLAKGTYMKDGVLALDGITTTVYALLRDAASMDTQQMPEWKQSTKDTTDMRSVWVLQDAVLVLEKKRPENETMDWDAYSIQRSAVFWDLGAHPSGPPASVYAARALAQRYISISHSRMRESLMEFADLL